MTSHGGRLTPDVPRGSVPPPVPLAVAASTAHARRSTTSQSRPRFIGMDVHTEPMAVASVAQEQGAAVTALGPMGTRPGDRDPLVRQMPSKATHRMCGSAAGPGGSWLYRYLTTKGYHWWG